MTNLEMYHKIFMKNLEVREEDLKDEVLAYNRYPGWDSVGHMELVAEMEEKFKVHFGTLDITSFDRYSAGIEILKKLGVDI